MKNDYESEEQQTIARSEQELAQAHLEMDLAKIDRLLHEDYTILHPDGRKENKSAVLDSYRQGNRRWHSASVEGLDIVVNGNLAMASGTWTASGRNGQQPFDYSARFLSMWRKENGRWQNIAYQSLEDGRQRNQ